MSNKNQVPTFLKKFHDIVGHPSTQEIVCWSKDGLKVVINDLDRLFTEIVAVHFMQKNVLSFIRQLNMYDFKKRKQPSKRIHCYENPNFREGRPDLLHLIRRQTS